MAKKKFVSFWDSQQCIAVMCAMNDHHAATGFGANIDTKCPICEAETMNYENRMFHPKEAQCRTCDASLQKSISQFSKQAADQ
jgi:hypothetical protein